MSNVMAILPNIGGALRSTPQSLADAHYWCHAVMLPRCETRWNLYGTPTMPPSYIWVSAVVWECGEGHADTQIKGRQTCRWPWALYISPRLCLMRNVMTNCMRISSSSILTAITLAFFRHLFRKRTFRDKWHRVFIGWISFLSSTQHHQRAAERHSKQEKPSTCISQDAFDWCIRRI